jgi:hypothetical protein
VLVALVSAQQGVLPAPTIGAPAGWQLLALSGNSAFGFLTALWALPQNGGQTTTGYFTAIGSTGQTVDMVVTAAEFDNLNGLFAVDKSATTSGQNTVCNTGSVTPTAKKNTLLLGGLVASTTGTFSAYAGGFTVLPQARIGPINQSLIYRHDTSSAGAATGASASVPATSYFCGLIATSFD